MTDRIQSTTAMAAEIERLKTEVERLYLDGIHTCSDECQRVTCVQRREIEQLRTEKAERDECLQWVFDTLQEINPSNYDHDDVCSLNAASVEVAIAIRTALGQQEQRT